MKFSILLKSGELLTPENSSCFLRSDGKLLEVGNLEQDENNPSSVFYKEGEFEVIPIKSQKVHVGFVGQLNIKKEVTNRKVAYLVESGQVLVEKFKGLGAKSKAINWARDFYNDESLVLEK